MSSQKQQRFERVVLPEKVLQKKSYAWHAHDVREVLSMYELTEDGLSAGAVKRQLAEIGPNVFSEAPRVSVFTRIIDQIKSPLVFVLLLAFGVTVVLGEYVDAGVILFALLIAVIVGVLQEGKASRAFEKLSNAQVKKATVIRDGHRHEINATEIVPGDIVVIQNGMQVPADMRLIRAKKLSINEAVLTGEWLPVKKHTEAIAVGQPLAERNNMAWMGTFVASGQGLGIVVATGDSSAVGKLAGDLQDVEEVDTPLQSEMKKVSHVMLYIIGVLVLGIFLIGVWQGQSIHEMLLMSIAIAVASVPEGLPAAVTIILAVGMESLLKRGGLVRNLLAAETLGSTTYILTDKTGTLTKAHMTLTELLLYEGGCVERKLWDVDSNVRRVIDISLGATDAYVDDAEDGAIRGDSVERAILETAERLKIDTEGASLRGRRVDYLPFESENRFAAGLSSYGEGYRLCVNGSPKLLLENAHHILTKEGAAPLSEEKRSEIKDYIKKKTSEGKRLLAVAYQDVTYDDIPDDANAKSLLTNLVFAGVLVLDDPLREGIADVVANVQSAGATILLITGDNPQTAVAIAAAAGITRSGSPVLTGVQLAKMSDEEILDSLEETRVFARVLPSQKMRIAQILQQRGEIVAMTGDGINDAPALRRANIGIAIGSGTEVAKESSDLVLVNDSFETIYAAIEEGRRIIANLRKIVGYLLTTSLSEVVLVGAAIITGAATPILPAQILWANVIEEGLMSVAFAFEKGEKGAMRRRPQDIHEEGILSRDMITFMAFVVTVLSGLLLVLYFYLRHNEVPISELRSVMFLAVSIDSLFLAFAFRSLTTPIWKIPLMSNMFFVGSFLVSGALLAIVLTIPFFQHVLSYEPLPKTDVILVALFGMATLMTLEFGKWIFFERRK